MSNILSTKAMLATVTISRWSARCVDKDATADVHTKNGAQEDAGRYSKRLIAREALATITTTAASARHYHYAKTLPWVHNGARLLPSALYVEYTAQMHKFKNEFDDAVRAFVADYDQYVKDAKKRLGRLYRADDYPDRKEVAAEFGIEIALDPVPDAEDFRVSIAKEHLADLRAESEARILKGIEDAQKDTLQRVVDVVGHMAEKLRAYKPATKKGEKGEGIFRDSLIANVRELACVLPAFNLTGSNSVGCLAHDIESKLCGVDAETLRNDPDKRAEVASAAEAILKEVNDLM